MARSPKYTPPTGFTFWAATTLAAFGITIAVLRVLGAITTASATLTPPPPVQPESVLFLAAFVLMVIGVKARGM